MIHFFTSLPAYYAKAQRILTEVQHGGIVHELRHMHVSKYQRQLVPIYCIPRGEDLVED